MAGYPSFQIQSESLSDLAKALNTGGKRDICLKAYFFYLGTDMLLIERAARLLILAPMPF